MLMGSIHSRAVHWREMLSVLFSGRGNLVKAKWIPSEQMVELQTPAVSTKWNKHTPWDHRSACLISASFSVWECCSCTGKVLADDGLFRRRQAASPPWRGSLPDGVCECFTPLGPVILCILTLIGLLYSQLKLSGNVRCEQGSLQVFYRDLPLSIQDGYEKFLSSSTVSLQQYQVHVKPSCSEAVPRGWTALMSLFHHKGVRTSEEAGLRGAQIWTQVTESQWLPQKEVKILERHVFYPSVCCPDMLLGGVWSDESDGAFIFWI